MNRRVRTRVMAPQPTADNTWLPPRPDPARSSTLTQSYSSTTLVLPRHRFTMASNMNTSDSESSEDECQAFKDMIKDTHPESDTDTETSDSEGEQDRQCVICGNFFEPEDRITLGPCGHDQFCYHCIKQWIKTDTNCPTCLARFTELMIAEDEKFCDIMDALVGVGLGSVLVYICMWGIQMGLASRPV
jgi:hypothetical protein